MAKYGRADSVPARFGPTSSSIPYRERLLVVALVVLASLCAAERAGAQTLDLTLSPSTITFSSADPDTTPSIPAPAITVTYRVRFNSQGNWQITLLADQDLTSSDGVIPISHVTWTATPAPTFRNGTLNRSVAQLLAAGTKNVNSPESGTVIFSLANSWNYNVGVYTATVSFTLVAP